MSLQVSRILHAGYIFATPQTQIAIDPVFENPFSRNCYAFPNVEFDSSAIHKLKWNAVFISHYHDDHCSLESLDLIDRATPIYIFCVYPELLDWIRELGFATVCALNPGQRVQVGDFEVRVWRALDADVDSIFQIRAKNMNILNVVDSWIDDEILAALVQEGPWDLVLWPFQTLRELEVLAPDRALPPEETLPIEWLDQLRLLNPRIVVPSSCQFQFEEGSWLNRAFFPVSYARFAREVLAVLSSSRVQKINPGETFLLNAEGLKQSDRLPWIKTVGDQDVDYGYDPSAPVPSTAEVARNFKALNSDEIERVRRFCQLEIGLQFKELAATDFFIDEKKWNLSIYDHLGTPWIFSYRIQNSQACLHPQTLTQPDWMTEIPLARLFGALADGESLTSIYLRIQAPADVDLLEDPLLRVLFNQEFGTYQKAQLRRLQLLKEES